MPRSPRYVLLVFLLVVFAGPVVLGPIFFAVAEPWGIAFHSAMNRALMVSALIAILLFRNRLHLRPWWRGGQAARQLTRGVVIALGSSFVMITLYALFYGFTYANLPLPVAARSVLLAFIAAIIVPIFEETIFRGFLVTLFVEAVGRRLGWFLSAVLFALAHFLKTPSTFPGHPNHWSIGLEGMAATFLNFGHFDFVSGRGLNLFLVGLILAGVFLRTRTLWMGAGLHGGWILILISFTALTRPIASPHLAHWGEDLLSSPATSATLVLLGLALWRFLPRAETPVASPR